MIKLNILFLGKEDKCSNSPFFDSSVKALFEDNFRKNVPATWKLFWKCYKSEPGYFTYPHCECIQ